MSLIYFSGVVAGLAAGTVNLLSHAPFQAIMWPIIAAIWAGSAWTQYLMGRNPDVEN